MLTHTRMHTHAHTLIHTLTHTNTGSAHKQDASVALLNSKSKIAIWLHLSACTHSHKCGIYMQGCCWCFATKSDYNLIWICNFQPYVGIDSGCVNQQRSCRCSTKIPALQSKHERLSSSGWPWIREREASSTSTRTGIHFARPVNSCGAVVLSGCCVCAPPLVSVYCGCVHANRLFIY